LTRKRNEVGGFFRQGRAVGKGWWGQEINIDVAAIELGSVAWKLQRIACRSVGGDGVGEAEHPTI
jgi:hypothetical protein